MSREAMQQAIEFCEFLWREVILNDWAEGQRKAVEEALRAALLADVTPAQMAHADAVAEPEQEPDGISWLKRDSGYFTAPTPRKPLTDEALHQVIRAGNYDSMEQFARAIERAHGITGETK